MVLSTKWKKVVTSENPDSILLYAWKWDPTYNLQCHPYTSKFSVACINPLINSIYKLFIYCSIVWCTAPYREKGSPTKNLLHHILFLYAIHDSHKNTYPGGVLPRLTFWHVISLFCWSISVQDHVMHGHRNFKIPFRWRCHMIITITWSKKFAILVQYNIYTLDDIHWIW